uniref:50S ribosomal protein L28 n=1 Tax=Helicotheca tamesis TaxID=374047 RepID=A0A7S2HHS0_9STRA|mmetsp:Transcript_18166/g.25000  ORF Transcript_18166/g.25000 Transcript_18166/m.25000 type:complete len:126 (+) Transcript_18166:136-513(+)|eukprot:CAMPEP_0185725994 /NCGR_PEP_ID=MMETSP1171-20130828/2108_1 /TAXON_ID=374046 /ORGANISM="Helicotheca tamensis, Strain CCMP826" /LENGTH=125 /DNA_ID=CAMNT_0028394255 /DNA_START=145 /DNA_END=522 /DNA_ORIENTATION=+
MKSSLAVLIFAIVAAAASGFGFTGAPLQSAPRVSNANNGASSMVMRARECDLLGKKANRKARVVTFSHKRIHKVQAVNLHWKRYQSDELGRTVRLRLSTKAIKTVAKYGSIDAAARKFGLDLSKF